MLLRNVPEWSELEKMCIYLNEKKVQINDSQLFEEFQKLKVYLAEATKENEWILKPAHAKWVHCFQSETGTSTMSSQLLICCKYLFAIPSHNANVERVFNLMNIQWTDERNQLDITVEALP